MAARLNFVRAFVFSVCTVSFADVRLLPVDPSPGHTQISLNGISSDGTTVVGWDSLSGHSRPIRWTIQTGTIDIAGDIPGSCQAISCSGGGQTATVFGAFFAGTTGYLWNDSLGWRVMELPSDALFCVPCGVSDDGLAVAGHIFANGRAIPFRWTQTTGYQVLPNPPGATFTESYAISGDGSVIAGVEQGGQAYYWRHDVGSRPVGAQSNLLSIRLSPNGRFITGGGDGRPNVTPWFFDIETETITLLQGIEGPAEAQGITDDGALVVGTVAGHTAFIWDAGHGMRRLGDVLDADYGLDVSGWNFIDAIGISGDGRVIAGNGTFQGFNRSWVVQFDTPQPYRGRPRCQGDVNSDGRVSLLDLGLVLSEFQLTGPDLVGDCNEDGIVDALDLNIVTLDQGQRCLRPRSIAVP